MKLPKPCCVMSKATILYKAFYFVFYAGYMSFLLYVPVYFKYLGLTAIHVGLLNGTRPLMQTIGAPLWGVIGDKFRMRKIIFMLAFIIMTVKTLLFVSFRPEHTLCIVTQYNTSNNIVKNETYLVKHDIFKRWTQFQNWEKYSDKSILEQKTYIPLAAQKSLKHRERSDAGTKSKYKQHWKQGSKGGEVLQHFGTFKQNERTVSKMFYNGTGVHYKLIYDNEESRKIFFMILLLVICGDAFDAAVFTLADTSCLDTLGSENYGYYRLWGSAGWGLISPIIGIIITHVTRDNCGTTSGSYHIIFYFYAGFMYLGFLLGSHFDFSYNHNDHVHETVKSVLLNFHYGIFLFVTFYAGVCYGFLLYFINWFIDSLGGTAVVMGTATACKSIMDVLGFFFAGKIIDMLGHLNTVTVSLTAYIGSFVSYSFITEPWYVVPIEVLHAAAYALVWSSSVSYLNKAAPAGSSATVQGILQGVYWGLGTGGGTIVGGYVSHVFGFRSTFRGFAVVTGVVLVVFLATQFISKYSNLPQTDESEGYASLEDDGQLNSSSKSNNSIVSGEEYDWKSKLHGNHGTLSPLLNTSAISCDSIPLKESRKACKSEDDFNGQADKTTDGNQL